MQPPPVPSARTYFDKYRTHDATAQVFRERLGYGLSPTKTASAFGRVSVWARKGGEADGVGWACCFMCFGSCLLEQQRMHMEVKLHRWHKERGDADAAGEPRIRAHAGSGGLCSLRWWPCTRPWLVAENVAVLGNFKRAQGLGGWPAREAWASGGSATSKSVGRMAPGAELMERELQPAVEGEASPLVRPAAARSAAPSDADADELEEGAPVTA